MHINYDKFLRVTPPNCLQLGALNHRPQEGQERKGRRGRGCGKTGEMPGKEGKRKGQEEIGTEGWGNCLQQQKGDQSPGVIRRV